MSASIVCALITLLLATTVRADSPCDPASATGWWAVQSTNAVMAVSPRGTLGSPFVRSAASGSVSTTFMQLHGDGTVTLEEMFVRGHRADDIILLRSDANTWTLDADCGLEITGTLSAGNLEHPHRMRARLTDASLQGIRQIDDQFSGVMLPYVITGQRL